MSDTEEETPTDEEEAPKKPSALKILLMNGAAAIVLGAVATGVVFVAPVGGKSCAGQGAAAQKQTISYEDIVFVNLEPLVVTLGPNAPSDYLKISISIETTKDNLKTVEHLSPRFRDVLNGYLRAVDERDLVEPFAMTRLRAQMLRRMQLVASEDLVSDVLITDFVLK